MTEKYFVDTNVLLYAYQDGDQVKRDRATAILENALADDAGVLSAQVLAEFYSVATRPSCPLMEPNEALDVIDILSSLDVEEIDRHVVRRAVEISQRFRLNYWDAQILAAALQAGVGRLLSEDLNAGQNYEGVTVENPFV